MKKTKRTTDQLAYYGDWQEGSVILQKLEGPIGQGLVEYTNGDRFEGSFHLSYANINGPAYAADGRFEFADGSVIDHAWINTSQDLEIMDLIGIYRVKSAKNPDTITPFYQHKRCGIELVLAEKPYAIEWYENEKIQELKVESYTFEQIDEDRSMLTVTLRDGTVVTQSGGRLENNNYDHWVFQTCLYDSIRFPDGITIDCFGYGIKCLKPHDGWFTIHGTDGKSHKEEWHNGKLVQLKDEKWDESAAKTIKLPDPFDKNDIVESKVWNRHVQYSYGRWIYDGEIKNDRPNGQGILIGGSLETRGRRYEGEFKNGLCHGAGVFTYPEGGIEQRGKWVEGLFQEADAPTEPIMLLVELSGDDSDTQIVEAKVGSFPYFTGFGGLRIDRIENHCITISDYGTIYLLTPGETIHLHHEIEGREWSDGCVYDSDDYYLKITWKDSV